MAYKMKPTQLVKLAIATLTIATINVASAGWNDNYSGGGALDPNHFTDFGPGSTATEIDQTKYEKINLTFLNATLWAPKSGVVIPVDEVAIKQKEAQDAEIRARLAGFGGWNSP